MQEVTDAGTVDAHAAAEKVGPVELAFNGAMAGVLFGAILGVILALIAQLGRTGHVPVPPIVAMPLGGAFAGISGAIVGLLAVDQRSLLVSIVAAVVVEGSMRLTVLAAGGLWWAPSVGVVLLTLLCGVFFGFVVHKLVISSIDWTRVDD